MHATCERADFSFVLFPKLNVRKFVDTETCSQHRKDKRVSTK